MHGHPHDCPDMQLALEDALVYSPKFREYGVPVRDGGTSYFVAHFCPFCGQRLPESLRDRWFDRLDALGLEPEDPSVPADMHTDQWWSVEPT